MEDYKASAKQKYEQFKIKEHDEQIVLISNILEIEDLINNIHIDKSDDNVIINLLNIKIIIEKIYDCLDDILKNKLINNMYLLMNILDEININRIKDVSMIDNVKEISYILTDIFKLVNIEIDIVSMDTSGDEELAKKLETLGV
jgi:hypothetical protein